MKNPDKNNPFKLYVEGIDDLAVITSIWIYHNSKHRFFVMQYDEENNRILGIDHILKLFSTRLKVADFQRLGIVVDADFADSGRGITHRWASLKGILVNAGYAPPDDIDPGGLVLEKDGLRVGVWIMPDNASEGMLEDFVASMIGEGDPLLARATGCVDAIPDPDRKFPGNHRLKAIVHTWLAWQEEPGKPFGIAIQNKSLDAKSTAASSLLAWLNKLYE